MVDNLMLILPLLVLAYFLGLFLWVLRMGYLAAQATESWDNGGATARKILRDFDISFDHALPMHWIRTWRKGYPE